MMPEKRMLYFLRHGATEGNEKGLYYGSTDLPLSEQGIQGLIRRKEKGGYPDILDCDLFSSGMLRTDQTLQILFPGARAAAEPELREMDFGIFEMRGYEDLKTDPLYCRWISGNYESNICPGGESARQQAERVRKAFLRVFQQSRRNLFFIIHGGTIAIIMDILFPGTAENRWYWQCEPGEGFAVSVTGEKGTAFWRIPYEK